MGHIFEKFGTGANDLESSTMATRASTRTAPRRRARCGRARWSREAVARARASARAGRMSSRSTAGSGTRRRSSPVERLIGKMVLVADGVTEVPGRTNVKAGTILYKVLWEGFPPEIATWEDEDDIPCGEVTARSTSSRTVCMRLERRAWSLEEEAQAEPERGRQRVAIRRLLRSSRQPLTLANLSKVPPGAPTGLMLKVPCRALLVGRS